MSAQARPSPGHESSAPDVGRRVRQLITTLLAHGSSPDIDLVAATMGTSVRTLQRRLCAKGLTYTEVIQRARCAAAQRMLKDRRPKIGEIARALGYPDPAHFTRAFQRWTGVTPRDFRDRCAVEKRSPPADP